MHWPHPSRNDKKRWYATLVSSHSAVPEDPIQEGILYFPLFFMPREYAHKSDYVKSIHGISPNTINRLGIVIFSFWHICFPEISPKFIYFRLLWAGNATEDFFWKNVITAWKLIIIEFFNFFLWFFQLFLDDLTEFILYATLVIQKAIPMYNESKTSVTRFERPHSRYR